jgi:hypothetical protein
MSKLTNKDDFIVPGRISLDELHKQEKDLVEAQKATSGNATASQKVFKAVSLYGVAIDFALIIAIPLIILVWLGKFLDTKYQTNFFVLIGLAVALTVSIVGLKNQIKRLQELMKKK